jgi:alkylation response protein AidB-like acyl-CoA dehydrogenase
VPEEFGGLGVASIRDLALGISRLARGDGSTAIALNMHFGTCWNAARIFRGEQERGEESELRGFLELLGGGLIAPLNATEPGTDLLHPLTELTRVDGGWAITGRKTFGTLSPVTDLFVVTTHCRVDGRDVRALAFVLNGTPGLEVRDNWDALGMRASGSHDVVYGGCVVPDEQVRVTDSEWGEENIDDYIFGSAANLGLVAAFLGIAERAAELAVEMVRTRKKVPDTDPLAARPGIQQLAGENEVDLATCRALLDRQGRFQDEFYVARPVADDNKTELRELFADFQAAKLVVNRKAIDIVDRALTMTGGVGYLSASPLSRLYRDVRAGPFMQPLSPNEAPLFIGKVALGLETSGYG